MTRFYSLKFDHSIHFTFAAKPYLAPHVLVFVPGGPGLSSAYCRPFMGHANPSLMGIDLALLDLPCHDLSRCPDNNDFLNSCKLIWEALENLATGYRYISLFGHSLGGYFLLAPHERKIQINQLILSSVPYKLQPSSTFSKKKTLLALSAPCSNRDFISYFGQLVPLYFKNPSKYDRTIFWPNGSFWEAGQIVLRKIKDLEKMPAQSGWYDKLTFLQGDTDRVVPDNNLERINEILQNDSTYIIENSGHFPFLEQPDAVINSLANIFSE